MTTHLFGITDRVFNYSRTLGRMEFGGFGFRHPVDFASGKNGFVYVVNRANEERVKSLGGVRVTMLTLKEEYVGEFGRYGDGDGEFRWPTSIALDSQDNVFVSDEWLQRITMFDPKGKFIAKWQMPASPGEEIPRPSGLAFDEDDNLYVVDRANHRVQVFTGKGNLIRQFGGFGSGEGQFNMPWGVTVDSGGNVWVADWRNDRIQKLTPEGEYLGGLGSSGDLPGQFNRPTNLAVDQDGDIYVADWRNNRVQVFTPDFRYVTSMLGDATLSPWAWEKIRSSPLLVKQYQLMKDMTPLQRLLYPVAVEVDSEGAVAVLETARHRIQVYQKEMG